MTDKQFDLLRGMVYGLTAAFIHCGNLLAWIIFIYLLWHLGNLMLKKIAIRK